MSNDLRLAALMCSRVCHDLISPVSALNNGLEVLNEDDDPEMREHALSLIEMSGKQASAKLQFARLAFGASSFAADELPFSEAQKVLDALLVSPKLKTQWRDVERTVDKSIIKILMNLAVVAADMIPRGGVLNFICAPEDGEFTIEAVGDRAKIADGVKAALVREIEDDALDPRSIQPFVTGLLIADANLELNINQTENNIQICLVPAQSKKQASVYNSVR